MNDPLNVIEVAFGLLFVITAAVANGLNNSVGPVLTPLNDTNREW
jgi:hypothetical protein